MKIENCRGCGRILMVHPVANLRVRLESEPLDAQAATQALLGGRNLWRVTPTSCKGARPAELSALRERGVTEGPRIHQEHRCTAVSRPGTPFPVLGDTPSPKGPENAAQSLAAHSTPSSAPREVPSGAPSADQRPSEGFRRRSTHGSRGNPSCSLCGHPVDLTDVETYALVELGATVVDAFHVGGC